MTLVDIPYQLAYQWPSFSTFNNNVIDASGEIYGMPFIAPKAGTIDRIGFRTNTVTTGATVDVRLETVNDVGAPSGSLVAAGANASQVIANADDNTFFEVTLGTPPTVTFGQRLAICINWAASGNMQLSSVPGANAWILTSGGTALFTGSWAFGTNTWGVGCVRYDDTTYPRISGMFPITTITTTNLASNTTPDERATKFVPPYDCKIAGGQVMITTGSWADGEDYDLVLYDSGGSSLASVSVTGGVGIAAPRVGLFSTPVTVAAGSTYRLAVKPTTTNAFQISQYTWATNARGNAPGVTSWTADSSTRTDAGSWTDDTATGHNIIPILSAVDDGTGAGAQQYGFPAGS